MSEYASFDHTNAISMSGGDSGGPYISTCKQDQPDLDQSRLEALQYPPQVQVQNQLQDLQSQAGHRTVDNQLLSQDDSPVAVAPHQVDQDQGDDDDDTLSKEEIQRSEMEIEARFAEADRLWNESRPYFNAMTVVLSVLLLVLFIGLGYYGYTHMKINEFS